VAATDTGLTPAKQSPALPTHPSSGRDFRPDIQGLRAIAVLAVVLDHSGLAVHGGYIGVDIFFVISGYLITSHLFGELSGSGHISLARFYAGRIRRILPAATVVIVATLLAAWKWDPPLEIHSVGLDAIAAAFFCINFRIAETGANYFANPAPSPFQQFWSLAIEEQFYALWPLLLLAVSWPAKRMTSSRRAISITLIIVIAASLATSVTLTKSGSSWAYFGLQSRAWALALGALVAINAEGLSRAVRRIAGPLSWLGLAAIIGSAFFFTTSTSYPGIAVALPVVATAFVITAGISAPRRGAEAFLGLGPFQYIGKISYSWYLWHWPIFIFLPDFLGHVATNQQIVLALVGSFVVASVSYAVVEQPFRRNHNLTLYPRRGLRLGAGLVGISLLSAIMVMTFVDVPTATGAAARQTASISTSVALAAHLRSLPSNLSPPLADVPNGSPPACLATSHVDALVTCKLGDVRANHTVALFGDSHAWQWTRPLAAIASKRGWKLVTYTKGACPLDPNTFTSISSFYNFPTYAGDFGLYCEKWLTAVLARLATIRPELVIMSSLTYPFVTPTSLARTIDKVRADGSKVVWLQDTPLPLGPGVPACLSEHPNEIQLCGFSRAYGLRYPKLRDALLQAAVRAGAEVVHTVQWFCTATDCPPVIAGTVAYFDNSHVANAYALKLTDDLSTALATDLPDVKPPH
jgi:peptidoglycan/LPS O-acetylase OafA/YrhL